MAARLLVLSLCFLCASAYIARASKAEPAFAREPFARLPLQVDAWQGRDFELADSVLSVLGTDDYVNRVYTSGTDSVGLYIAFYQTQRQGSTIHSPLNCLPGAGWNPVDRSHIRIALAPESSGSTETIEVNRIIIQKGIDRQMTLYWYQAHGRVVANEYWGKIYTVLDAMRMNRTDGSLVRIITPIAGSGSEAEQTAQNIAVRFVQSMFPLFSRHLPA